MLHVSTKIVINWSRTYIHTHTNYFIYYFLLFLICIILFLSNYKNFKVRNHTIYCNIHYWYHRSFLYQKYFSYILRSFVPDQRVISILNTRESIYKKISFIFICFTTYVKNPLKSQRNTSMCLFVRCGEIILIRVIIILR